MSHPGRVAKRAHFILKYAGFAGLPFGPALYIIKLNLLLNGRGYDTMTTLILKPQRQHEISPYLYMQFMEPLGVCDTSVDAAWNFRTDDWHEAVIEKTRELAPTMIRWGGCFASYYHWEEGVGPQKNRIPMENICWGGMYCNQVGTHEVIDFCRRVGAEPLLVVNMETEGYPHWRTDKFGTSRVGTDAEAARWVSYCNAPGDSLRRAHGKEDPYGVRYWQLGNETSYSNGGALGFTSDQCREVTGRFARKMRAVDPDIRLIAWGDETRFWKDPSVRDDTWCRKMSTLDEIELIAFHHHFDSGLPECPFPGNRYRVDFENTWRHFMHAHKSLEEKLLQMRADRGGKRLAMTEGHFSFKGKNRGNTLSTWAAGVAYARCHNVLHRNSDVLEIATLADFCGNIWSSNALMIPTPIHSGECYLMPVGAVMALFRRNQGRYAVELDCGGLDAVASRTGDTFYIHAVNDSMTTPRELKPEIPGGKIQRMRMEYIAADPAREIGLVEPHCFDPQILETEGDTVTLPPAAVAAIRVEGATDI